MAEMSMPTTTTDGPARCRPLPHREGRFPAALLAVAAVLLVTGLFLLLGQGGAGATGVHHASQLPRDFGQLGTPNDSKPVEAKPGEAMPAPEQAAPEPGQPTPSNPIPGGNNQGPVAPSQTPEPSPRAPELVGDRNDDTKTKALVAGVAAGLGGLLLGLVLGALIGRGRKQPKPAPAVGPTTTAVDPALVHQREVLIKAAIDSRDQVTSQALADGLGRALWEAGIMEVRAEGQRFDPRLHQAVHQVATADPNLEGVIAATERPGYTDNGRVIRLPEVVVHRYGR